MRRLWILGCASTLAVTLVCAAVLSPRGEPRLSLEEMAAVRGADPNQLAVDFKTCEDLQGQGIFASYRCAGTTFAMDCVYCDMESYNPYQGVFSPNGWLPGSNIGTTTCAFPDKYLGTCQHDPLTGEWYCDIPPEPSGTCSGEISQFILESDGPGDP